MKRIKPIIAILTLLAMFTITSTMDYNQATEDNLTNEKHCHTIAN